MPLLCKGHILSQDSKLQTSCKDCIFAVYTDKTQTGCKANDRLSKYAAEGRVTEVYDEDKEFSIVDGICLFCKNKDWLPSETLHKKYSLVRQNITIKYECIILADATKSATDIATTLHSISEQVVPPTKISLVLGLGNVIKAGILQRLLNETEIKWQLKYSLDADMTPEDVIDQTLKFDRHPYYAVFQAGYTVPVFMFDELDRAINDNLLNFAMLRADSNGNGLIVPRAIHDHLGGNFEKSLEEKIVEDNGVIYNVKDILKSMSL